MMPHYATLNMVINMRILICDDDPRYAVELQGYIDAYMKSKGADYIIDTINDPEQAGRNNNVYQLVFLDIQMESINGISAAKILKERNSKVIIFFITSFKNYQDDAMDLRAFRFFEKPVDPGRLYSGLDKAMEYIDESYVDFYVFTNNEHRQIHVDDVIYVERVNRQVTLVTVNGCYTTRESFDDWAEKFQNTFFYRVHNSFIVNLHYVTSYKYSEVIVQNNIRIPIASRRQASFHKFWFAYLRRR